MFNRRSALLAGIGALFGAAMHNPAGQFTIAFNGQTTANLRHYASPRDIRMALAALTDLGVYPKSLAELPKDRARQQAMLKVFRDASPTAITSHGMIVRHSVTTMLDA